ncbi:30S ribosomal protein S1 [Phocicoccus pinnipedialis]|uniref:30S ribosomal protein S1 n=1 Tax=Phocicoccus pinnipedialis TaxID=110845 RepID=A0A6V7REW7_9BACL|nr:30S ribosomal protein S1 [Jeotgalicoccus pinnipedialis]MBP1939358.1 small subunit ribosomal protein S1 [Jeotgalicoccus pinnipedialis]CAD2075706.1 30S ribosomal protein S1 [Jeotgalicoccus pinnipedialis]
MTNEEHLEKNLEVNETSEETQNEKYSEGDTVTGKVSKIEEKFVEVMLEDGVVGIVPISQLTSKRIETTDEAATLDQDVTAKVIKVEDNTTLILSIRQYDNEATYKELQSQKDNDDTISATVIEVVPAGLVVDVGVRGFIPASLISTEYVEDLTQFDGQTLDVKIEDVDVEKNRVILNRRKLEEKSQHEERLKVLDELVVGDIVKGEVVRTTNFGAFINVNGVDGLAHISELSYERVENVEDAVTIGETLNVKVLSVDPETERISLSVKQAGESPFQKFFNEHQTGDSVKGTVKRLVDFGAFVEVAAGVEGLVHVSEISHDHVGHPEDELKPEEEIDVKIIGFDPDKEKTSLSIKALKEKPKNDTKQKNATVYSDSDEESLTLGDILGDKLKKLDL